ncbi:MAG: efflux RND transporter periplasmic adaptor subunit [Sphingobacteriales bacterium]|nr:MAG: efflux RND transporter periplasmic adaptor subunit [Sphingobacteriales bacterium]
MLYAKNYIVLAISLSTLLVACGGGGGDKKAELEKLKKEQADLQAKIATLEKETAGQGGDSATQPATLVAVSAVQTSDFKHYVEVQGKVDAEQNLMITPKVPGTMVTDVLVERGDKVSKGQVLAKLDQGAMSESLAEVQNQLDLANTVFQKQKRLWDQKIGTEIQYLQAKNNRDALQRRMATMQQQFSNFTLRSPINGVVDDVTLRAGEVPMPGMGGIRVVNLANTKIVADISESYAGKIQQGDEVLVSIPDAQKEFKTKVRVVSKTINPTNRTFLIELRPDASQVTGLQPNMVAVVKVNDYKKANAITLPVNAVQKDDVTAFVFTAVKEGNQTIAKKTPVKTGETYGGQTEIISGLSANDKVITSGYQNVVDGQAISFQ